ncbi:MAG: ATP-dependent DNA ligase [Dehalococcoidia bacterium]|nr:ATP-dependent DNA ligase [Dehalococcoidia bacterium]
MRFSRLADFFLQLEDTSSRNRMVEILAQLFIEADVTEIDKIVYLTQGRVVPAYERLEFGVGENLTADAIALATGKERAEVRAQFALKGDFGVVVGDLLPPEGAGLSVSEVFSELYRIATSSGGGSVQAKVEILAGLLRRMGSLEGRMLMRIPLDHLRLGIGDPTLMDALSFAKVRDKSLRKYIERAYNIRSDLGQVARLFWESGAEALTEIEVEVGTPVRPALAERVQSSAAIIDKLGRCAAEPKFDGFRCQIHKDGDLVKVFSRNLEDFSEMFPELIEGTRRQVALEQAILEGEALAVDTATGDFLPFQVTVQRKRKHGIEAMQHKYPLKLMAFDMLYADGVDLTHEPYLVRRKRLVEAIRPDDVFDVAEVLITEDPLKLEAFFADKIQRGLEGIVCKRLDSPYQAGARNFNWIKLKRSMKGKLTDTVDTVVVGYWYGKGGRTRFGIGSLLTAVYDSAQDRFVTIARLGTGLTEEEWVAMKVALDAVTSAHQPARLDSVLVPDVWAEPAHVLEIQADEITRSPIHTCGLGKLTAGDGHQDMDNRRLGYALRFPRAVNFIRVDKRPEEATTVEEIIRMFSLQGKRTN